MNREWFEAGDELQLPFMIAAGRVRQGERVACPRLDGGELRYYYHYFDLTRDSGTLWAWCPSCRTHTHLPRVSPGALAQTDPFADFGLREFAELELDPDSPLLDKLDHLWDVGSLPGE